MDITKNNENEFLKHTEAGGGSFILAIGAKGSGKSYLMTNFLREVLFKKVFKNVHFVCPCYSGEQSNSYDFLKTQKHVLIYPHYSEKVSKRVDTDRRKAKTLFLIDDASGELMQNIDTTLINLITTARHFKGCVIYVAVHSAKRILLPIVRQNIDHLFIYRIINASLLKDLYDEYFSMLFDTFLEFKSYYLKSTAEKNTCLYFSLHCDGIDNNVKNWKINNNKNTVTLQPTANTHKPEKKPEEQIKTSVYGPINLQAFFKKNRKKIGRIAF